LGEGVQLYIGADGHAGTLRGRTSRHTQKTHMLVHLAHTHTALTRRKWQVVVLPSVDDVITRHLSCTLTRRPSVDDVITRHLSCTLTRRPSVDDVITRHLSCTLTRRPSVDDFVTRLLSCTLTRQAVLVPLVYTYNQYIRTISIYLQSEYTYNQYTCNQYIPTISIYLQSVYLQSVYTYNQYTYNQYIQADVMVSLHDGHPGTVSESAPSLISGECPLFIQ
jgi:hypothetical protein